MFRKILAAILVAVTLAIFQGTLPGLHENAAYANCYGALVGEWAYGQRRVIFDQDGTCEIHLPDGRTALYKISYNPDTGEIVGEDEDGNVESGRIRWHTANRFTWYSPTGFRVYDRVR